MWLFIFHFWLFFGNTEFVTLTVTLNVFRIVIVFYCNFGCIGDLTIMTSFMSHDSYFFPLKTQIWSLTIASAANVYFTAEINEFLWLGNTSNIYSYNTKNLKEKKKVEEYTHWLMWFTRKCIMTWICIMTGVWSKYYNITN